MDTVVIVIMMLVCFNFVLKQTYRKLWMLITISVLCCLFMGLIRPIAIEQSKSQIQMWLSNPALMLDTSVILTIEVVIQIAYCLMATHMMTSGTVKRSTLWTYKALRWFPGVLIFPVLFHLEVQAIFALPGVDFDVIAWGLGAIVLLLIPGLTYAIKWLLPEKDLRLEIFFLSNALIAILGIIATVNGRTAVQGVSEVNVLSLLTVIAMILFFGAIGLAIFWYKGRKK